MGTIDTLAHARIPIESKHAYTTHRVHVDGHVPPRLGVELHQHVVDGCGRLRFVYDLGTTVQSPINGQEERERAWIDRPNARTLDVLVLPVEGAAQDGAHADGVLVDERLGPASVSAGERFIISIGVHNLPSPHTFACTRTHRSAVSPRQSGETGAKRASTSK